MNEFLNDYLYLLDELGTEVKVNSTVVKAAIKSSSVNTKYDDKIISTNVPLHTGDFVEMNNCIFLIISEINGSRSGINYAGVMRRCDFTIPVVIAPGETVIIGYDDFGRPEYEETDPITANIPVVVDNESITITSDGAINLSTNKMQLTTKDDENARKIDIGDLFTIAGKTVEVNGLDQTKPGLIVMKCETPA